jgi:hypothetical protein
MLVDTELLRANRTESSLALQYWFGASEITVWHWRRAFGVTKRSATTRWQQWQLDLLGTAPDAELAARFRRSQNAVRVMRNRLGRRALPRLTL